MTVFEATPQYEPADRQSWFFSGDSCMRAQNMVRALMEPKSPATATPTRGDDRFLNLRFGVLLSTQTPPRERSPFRPAPENSKSP
jgi:hypothetical protein